MKKITMIVERTNTGYSAYAKDSTGEILPELTEHMLEVMNFYFEETEGNGRIITEKDLNVTLIGL